MFFKTQHYYVAVQAIVAWSIIFMLNGCDSLIPEEYASKEYPAAEVDRSAGDIMTPITATHGRIIIISNSSFTVTKIGPDSTLTITDYAKPVTSYPDKIYKDSIFYIQLGSFDTSVTVYEKSFLNASNVLFSYYLAPISAVSTQLLNRYVDRTTSDSLLKTDNQIVNSKFALLADSLRALKYDTLMYLSYPDSQKISYAKISSAQSKDVYVYTSLFFNETNVSQFIDMEFVKSDTSLALLSVDASSETATSLIVYRPGGLVGKRTRYKVHLEAGTYVVRLIMSDPLLLRGSDSGALQSKFKMFISSI